MPFVGAILGAILTGLFYWLVWGQGLEYIEARMRESRERKRDAERRATALESQRLAPLRTLSDARDAAAALMVLVARQRGVPTPEQVAAIEHDMREVLGFNRELPERLALARFAAERAGVAEEAVDTLAPLFRAKLDSAERNDLLSMLRRVAELHGGPTELQEKLIERTERRLREMP
jgi:hypothetical protein